MREQGVPVETFSVKNAQGRTIAAYRFDDVSGIRQRGGRKGFARAFKTRLYELQKGRCAICLSAYEERYLQIDHRVPYEVEEHETDRSQPDEYMLLCGSCNRAKSWSCEHCINWRTQHNSDICKTCYWYGLAGYEHIAMQPLRRLDIVWSGKEVADFEQLRQQSDLAGDDIREYIKRLIRQQLRYPDDDNP